MKLEVMVTDLFVLPANCEEVKLRTSQTQDRIRPRSGFIRLDVRKMDLFACERCCYILLRNGDSNRRF